MFSIAVAAPAPAPHAATPATATAGCLWFRLAVPGQGGFTPTHPEGLLHCLLFKGGQAFLFIVSTLGGWFVGDCFHIVEVGGGGALVAKWLVWWLFQARKACHL